MSCGSSRSSGLTAARFALTKKADGTYTFKMPKGGVTVTAVFGCDGTGDCPSKNFTDLGESQWYHEYMDYARGTRALGGHQPHHYGTQCYSDPGPAGLRSSTTLEGKPAVTGDLPF